MRNQIVFITGPTSGIGRATALNLAAQGAALALLARNETKLSALVNELSKTHPNVQLHSFIADLSNLSEVRRVAKEIHSNLPRIDVLVNNAGLLLSNDREVSADGYELTLATNHLGPFLLTNLLFGLIRQSQAPRIVNVSSAGHAAARPDFSDLNLTRAYNPWRAYCNSKLFNILFTRELHRRASAQGLALSVNALHPGVVRTGFGASGGKVVAALVKLAGVFFISPEQGAETSVYLASHPDAARFSGEYFVNKRPVPVRHRAATAENEALLWRLSEEMTGAAFL